MGKSPFILGERSLNTEGGKSEYGGREGDRRQAKGPGLQRGDGAGGRAGGGQEEEEKGGLCWGLHITSRANRDTGAGPQLPESRTPALSQNQLGKSRHLSELQFPHLPDGENNSSSSSH